MAVPELTPSLLHTDAQLPTLITGPSLGTAALPLWGPALPYLKEHFQVIAWDLPGHGVSKPTTQEFTLAELATGEGKAEAIAQTVEGPVASVVPASALQLHPHATVVVDEAAASKLKLADYFRATYAAKPAWQGL